MVLLGEFRGTQVAVKRVIRFLPAGLRLRRAKDFTTVSDDVEEGGMAAAQLVFAL